MVSRHDIASVIAGRLKKDSSKNLSRQIAAYLLGENRTHELDSLMRDVMTIRENSGEVEVLAATAHDLNPTLRKSLESSVKQLSPEAKQVIVDEKLDASLIGGVKLNTANKQLDLSIRAKINHFKQLTSQGGA